MAATAAGKSLSPVHEALRVAAGSRVHGNLRAAMAVMGMDITAFHTAKGRVYIRVHALVRRLREEKSLRSSLP